MKFDPWKLIRSSTWFKNHLSAASRRSDLDPPPHPRQTPFQRVDFTLSSPWTKFCHENVVYQYIVKKRETDKIWGRTGSVRSHISDNPHLPQRLYYTSSYLWTKTPLNWQNIRSGRCCQVPYKWPPHHSSGVNSIGYSTNQYGQYHFFSCCTSRSS